MSSGAERDAAPPDAPLQPDVDTDLELADYAQRAYLEYALSVVKGRALPNVCDGQKPVQRRILYSMQRMGLGFSGTAGARPVKSARVVGDVLGRFHPHGDQAAYDALVRMAQDFSQRYPLIDGQGNFGSRDGDGAAAMRYTEARLSRISSLLLSELDAGTVDFVANYDGSTQEPGQLPARLPFTLLNGASGIAVGLATEIPSHNLREVANACIALIKTPALDDEALFAILPGPDYCGGGQLISAAAEIADAYRAGRGSLKVRARWKTEELARGQWQLVVTELPPGVSTQRVLEEIEELSNPKVKAGKKTLTPEQLGAKAALLAVLDAVRDEIEQGRRGAHRARAPDQPHRRCRPDPDAAGADEPRDQRADQPDADRHRRTAGTEIAAADAARVDRVPPGDRPAAFRAPPRQGARAHPHSRRAAARAAEHR